MKYINILTLLIFLSSCQGLKRYVLFDKKVIDNKQTSEIFFDRYGNLYPEVGIEHSKIFENNASLLGMKLNANDTQSINEIQNQIIASVVSKINNEVEKKGIDNVTFIMCGYNNSYAEAKEKLQLLKNRILNESGKSTYIIELYWDGTFTTKELQKSINYGKGVRNSYFVGMGLRRFINQLNVKKVRLLSHSQGANIITQALFNQEKKLTKKLLSDFSIKYSLPEYATINQSVRAAIVAPAIDGYETFIDYNKTSDNKMREFQFIVGFNKFDSALQKNFNIDFLKRWGKRQTLPKLFGSTTLGCDYNNEVSYVQLLFKNKFKSQNFQSIDFSCNIKQLKTIDKKIDTHALKTYLRVEEYNQLIDLLFQ